MSDSTNHVQRTERFDLRALYETSRLLSASLDLEFVLNNLLLTAMSKLLVTRGLVLLHDPPETAYRVATVKGLPRLKPGARLALDLAAGEHPMQGDEVPLPLQEMNIRLVIPIATAQRHIGVIGLGPKATREPYQERELEFVQSLVHMSSAAVQNSLMVQELRQANRDLDARVQELNTLFDLSQEFNATVDRDRLVKLLSFALMGQMLVGKHLFLLRRTRADEGASEQEGAEVDFEVVAAKGLREPALEPDLIRRLCKLEDPLLLQNEDEETAAAWQQLKQRGLVLALPIRHHGENCGMLCLGPKMTGRPYTPGDLEFLQALGNLAFVSIQNAYLVEEQIEKERLEEEMRLARQIQEGLLPQEIPSVPGLEVAALALPSREVGGDYFDVIALEDGRLLAAIADVTGKGVPAALLMANVQACLHVLVPMDLTLEEATAHINRVICGNTGYDRFITYFHAIYHPQDRRLDYVNAGHNPPMLIRADGSVEELDVGGLLLGVMSGVTYERGRVFLHPGDVLALFTDGVTEAMSPQEEEYGEARLRDRLTAHRTESAEAILEAVRADLRAFTGNPALLSDDLTMIVMKVVA
ncbi:protein serine phosphatase [Rhodothermaceae bacterium RA]|nr:protein serine phosphatase [Rhodothermaceae bacterium RA]